MAKERNHVEAEVVWEKCEFQNHCTTDLCRLLLDGLWNDKDP